jgi:hypothetical protein
MLSRANEPSRESIVPAYTAPSGDYVALSQEQFTAAGVLGQQLTDSTRRLQQNATDEEPMFTAEQMEEKTSVPASWFLEQARQEKIPHYKFIKYPRFRFSEIALYIVRRPAAHGFDERTA